MVSPSNWNPSELLVLGGSRVACRGEKVEKKGADNLNKVNSSLVVVVVVVQGRKKKKKQKKEGRT